MSNTDKKVNFTRIDGLSNIFMAMENVNASDFSPKQGRSGRDLPSYKGTMLFEDRNVEVAVWTCIDKNGKPYIRLALKDAVAAEHERHAYRMEFLQNRSEAMESRDELAEKPDRTEKTQPSKRQRKIA
tara:strand:+ start:11472 stop:11855 length:384 start_codon:yes stop_codon:yes gene_type:complete